MAKAKITLFGMYKFGINTESYDLFESISLPAGMDKDILIKNIMIRGGEFEPLYAEPEFYRFAVGTWFGKWKRTIEKWWAALNLDYNPLENYDRREDWHDDETNNSSNTTERNEMTTGQDKTTENSSGNTEQTVSAFNASTYQPAEKALTEAAGNVDSLRLSSTGAKVAENGTDMKMSGHSGRIHGNIGVTTSQQMLQSELDIARFNIYEEITDLFLTELTIFTY